MKKKMLFLVCYMIATQAFSNNWSLGAGAIFSPNPYRDTKINILPIPLVAYQNANFAWYGPSIKLRKMVAKGHTIGVLGMLEPRVFDPKDTPNQQLKLLDKRRRSYLIGPFYRHQSQYGDISLNVAGDVTGHTKGFYGDVSYGYPFHFKQRRYFFRPSIGVGLSDKKMTQYYYGISNGESQLSGLPVYNTSSSAVPYVGFFSGVNLWRKLYWLTILRASYLPNEVVNSPMTHSSRGMYGAFTGLTWEIGNKDRRFN